MTSALEALEHLSEDPEAARLARAREESMFFYHSSIASAERQGRKDGRREGLLEGKKEGLLEGKKEGLLEGEVQLLLRQLRRKFGGLSEGVETRVRAATEPELLDWSERILTATSLDDVFGE